MDSIKIFHVDAFTEKVFHGNPAAVCLLLDWFNDELMQAIAAENNLSETAFVIPTAHGYHIRWFTPKGEISLCGHATLAAGFVLFELARAAGNVVYFSSAGGDLSVEQKNGLYTLSLPRLSFSPLDNVYLQHLLDQPITAAYESGMDYLCLLASDDLVAKALIDLRALSLLPKRGLIITAPTTDFDFYSRCFYPKHNINEDPVTGSAHCLLAPFWAERLGKNNLHAIQGSYRKGELHCEVIGDRVLLTGNCKWYSKGELIL